MFLSLSFFFSFFLILPFSKKHGIVERPAKIICKYIIFCEALICWSWYKGRVSEPNLYSSTGEWGQLTCYDLFHSLRSVASASRLAEKRVRVVTCRGELPHSSHSWISTTLVWTDMVQSFILVFSSIILICTQLIWASLTFYV